MSGEAEASSHAGPVLVCGAGRLGLGLGLGLGLWWVREKRAQKRLDREYVEGSKEQTGIRNGTGRVTRPGAGGSGRGSGR